MSRKPPPVPPEFDALGDKLERDEPLTKAERRVLQETAVAQVNWLRAHRPNAFRELVGVIGEVRKVIA